MREYPEVVFQIEEYIRNNFADIESIDALAEMFNIGRIELYQWFKVIFKKSPNEYLRQIRFEKLQTYLLQSEENMGAFYYAYLLGYKSKSGVLHLVTEKTGKTFSDFRDSLQSSDGAGLQCGQQNEHELEL